MLKAIAVALVGVLVSCDTTVPPEDTSAIDLRLQQALERLRTEGPKPMLPELESVLEAYEDLGDAGGQAITLGHIGTCFKNMGQYTRALDFHQRALEKKHSLGLRLEEAKTLSNIGLVHWELGDYEKAAAHFEESVEIARELNDVRVEAAVLNNLGLVFDEWGEYGRSLETYQASLKMQRVAGDSESESYTLGNIGGVHLLLGRFRTALDYYLQALELSRSLGLRPGEAIDLGNLALCYLELGDSSQALQVLDEALQLAEETGQAKEQAYWHSGKGSALLRLGHYSEALREYREALGFYGESGARRELIETLGQIGSLELLLGDINAGEARFERALSEARSIEHPREVSLSLIALGESARLSGRLERARAFFSEALRSLEKSQEQAGQASCLLSLARIDLEQSKFDRARQRATRVGEIARQSGSRPWEIWSFKLLGDEERLHGSPESALEHYETATRLSEDVSDPEITWQLLHARGLALLDMGRSPEAVRALSDAVRLVESSRFQLESRRQRAGFFDRRYEPFFDLIRHFAAEGDFEQAFSFTERLRANLLFDLTAGEVDSGQGDPSRQIRELGGQIRHLRNLMREELDKPTEERRLKALSSYIAELERAETSYRERLSESGRPGHEPGGPDLPGVDEIRASLPDSTALLEYLQVEEQLLLFVLTRESQEVVEIDLSREQLATKVEIFIELIREVQGDGWLEPALSLYNQLIKPIEELGTLKDVEHLLLVPHVDLHYLPFAALATRRAGEVRFLADQFELSYLPAAAVMAGEPAENRQEAGGLLTVGPERARLQHAEEEVRAVSAGFEGDSTILEGPQATEAEFLRLAPRFRFIHLATHADFDKLNPMLSALELEEGEGHDGFLRVRDVLGLKLNAELVTLSACETAVGGGYFTAVPAGDDFVGLTRAFLEAGSRSVLSSLWRVNDRSTLELMTRFYARLQEGSAPAALRLAQKDLRSMEQRYQHPYYWAPFVLVSGRGEKVF